MRKITFLKSLLVAFMLMGGASSVWADVIETVGKTDKTSPVGTHSNTAITIKKGTTKIIAFNNYGGTEQNYYNWTIVAKEGNTEKFSVRADAFDNTSGKTTNGDWNYQTSTSRGGTKASLDWATFKTDMQDASCLAAITFGADGTLSLRATSECTTGNIYYHAHSVSGLTGTEVSIILYVDHSYLEITSITDCLGLVGSIDYTTPYANQWNEASKQWINPGEKAYYKFKNFNKRDAAAGLYNNWCVWAATENSDNLVIFCHNHSNTATNATYSKPNLTNADLDGATVEITSELLDAGDGTYTYKATAVTTKADGTVVTPDLVYQQTGIEVSKLKVYISPDANWLAVLESAVKKNITSAGWATYCSSNALDFTNDIDNLSNVYIVTSAKGGGWLNLTSVKGGTVPANTGLLIKGTEGTTVIPVAANGATDVSANKLEGVLTNTEIAAEAGYVLMNDATNGIGFYKNASTFTVGANTAYLPANFDGSSVASRPFFSFGDDATGINEVEGAKNNTEGAIFDMMGRKVAQPTRGLYIVNGKKVFIK